MSTAAQVDEEDHGHHHKETFVTKYIFSQDHKMIAKQYLDYRSIVYGYHWEWQCLCSLDFNWLGQNNPLRYLRYYY